MWRRSSNQINRAFDLLDGGILSFAHGCWFGTAFATGIVKLSIWRFLTGMGVGAALNLASTYVGELSPASKRAVSR